MKKTTSMIEKVKDGTIIKELKNVDTIKSTYKKFIIPNFSMIINTIVKGFMFIIQTFLKPFWFSKNSKSAIAPYVYTSFNMSIFYGTVLVFLDLCWKAATKGILSPEIVLPALGAAIVSLIALNHSMISLYNNGKSKTPDTTEEIKENDDKPVVQ